MRTILSLVMVCGMAGCGVEGEEVPREAGDDPSEFAKFQPVGRDTVFQSCGDPVCGGWRPKNLPGCGPFQAGDPCPVALEGLQCDPRDACNTILQCDAADPFAGPCPISLRSAKHDIAYLDGAERKKVHDELMRFRLARYAYNDDPAQATHLGFLIDDVGGSPAVAPNGQRVDVYGYASMAVAAVQEQQAQIDALRAELATLRAERACAR